MTIIKGSTILITGAAGGFGTELTKQLTAGGGNVILSDVSQQMLDQVANIRSAESAGQILALIPADLSSADGCAQLWSAIEELNTPVDILINNAGIAQFGPLHQLPPELWEMLIQINLLAPMRLCNFALPSMIERGRGHLVNISSIAGWIGPAGLSPYAASKFGLRGFSEALRSELRAQNVQVTAVFPFFSRTPILDSPQFGDIDDQELPDSIITDPTDVIAQVIKGIERNQAQIFPDRVARLLHVLKRFTPRLLPFVMRYAGV